MAFRLASSDLRKSGMAAPEARKKSTGLEADGVESHKKQAVQLEAITPAFMVHQLVAQRCGFERDASP